jgi:hypothetical protein
MELAFIAGLVALLLILGALSRLEHGQVAVQEQLNELSRHLGLMAPAGSAPSARVRELAAEENGYLKAIAAYRRETGSDLKLAKTAVDKLCTNRR